jgi:hypothetical protein
LTILAIGDARSGSAATTSVCVYVMSILSGVDAFEMFLVGDRVANLELVEALDLPTDGERVFVAVFGAQGDRARS